MAVPGRFPAANAAIGTSSRLIGDYAMRASQAIECPKSFAHIAFGICFRSLFSTFF